MHVKWEHVWDKEVVIVLQEQDHKQCWGTTCALKDQAKLFHADIIQGYDSNRKEKGNGSTDVPNREKRQVS